MDAVSNIARSGMLLAQRRLEQSAHNTANQSTDGFRSGAVRGVEQVQGGSGAGVRTEVLERAAIERSESPTEEAQEAPASEAPRGIEAVRSDTDPISETTERLGAVQAYRANLATLRASDEMDKSLLDIPA